jgi:hypothetical protein
MLMDLWEYSDGLRWSVVGFELAMDGARELRPEDRWDAVDVVSERRRSWGMGSISSWKDSSWTASCKVSGGESVEDGCFRRKGLNRKVDGLGSSVAVVRERNRKKPIAKLIV